MLVHVCVCVSSLYTYYTYNYSLTCIYTLIKTKEKIDTDVREQRARREKRRHDCNPKIALKISGNAPRFRHFTLVPRRDRATSCVQRVQRATSRKRNYFSGWRIVQGCWSFLQGVRRRNEFILKKFTSTIMLSNSKMKCLKKNAEIH